MTRTQAPLFATLCALAALQVRAQPDRPRIQIENGRLQAWPIAVEPGAGTSEVARVLSADLARSGLFRVLDPKSFLPGSDGVTEESVGFGRWTTVGAASLITGRTVPSGSTKQVEFALFDVARHARVLHGRYQAHAGSEREIAHRFADDVVKFFTQEPGDFESRIAYVRGTGADRQVVVADCDGANARAVLGSGINLHPAFSPDHRKLAFTSFRDGAAHLFALDLATGATVPLVESGEFASGGTWSPDGSQLAFSESVAGNTDIYLADADGSASKRLTNLRSIEVSPSFSPDGKQLAFVSDRVGTPQIYVMNIDGSNVRRLTFQGTYNQEPVWSPRGDTIAFSARDEHRSFDIFLVDVGSGKVSRVTQDQGNNESPSFSPNGRHLLFTSTRTGSKQIWMATTDGNVQAQLTREPEGATDGNWGPFLGGK